VQLILANRLGGRKTNWHLKVNTVFFFPLVDSFEISMTH
jgi:hypothetical protein